MDVERLNDTNDHIKTLFRFKRLKFKDGVEDGRQLGSLEDLSDKKNLNIKHFIFAFYRCLEA